MAFNLDSKVGDLLANEAARAVLDKNLPDFTSNPQLAMAQGFSLKMLAGLAGGRITPEMLAAVEAELIAL